MKAFDFIICETWLLSHCPVYQVLHQVTEDLNTNKKKTRDKPKLVSCFTSGTRITLHIILGFLCYSVGIHVLLSWDSCGTQLGFLWYSVGIPVVLKGDLLWYSYSLNICIFYTIFKMIIFFISYANA